MTIFIVSFVVLLLAVTAMAIGVLCGRPAIRGSCGGLTGSCGCAEPCALRKRTADAASEARPC